MKLIVKIKNLIKPSKKKVSFKHKSFGEVKNALKLLRESPNNHGFSKEEVEELTSIEKDIESFSKNISEGFTKINNDLEKGFKAMVAKLDILFTASMEQLKHLVSAGWYISPTVFGNIGLGELVELTKEENTDKFEKYILDNFSKEPEKILKSLSTAYPNRKVIFNEMQELYKKGFYNSFISLCYSQTDGICNDKWNVGFFDTDRQKGYSLKLSDKMDLELESISHRIAKQLSEPKNEITKHSSEFNETEKRNSFNRHFVIHGHSFNYGTKKNAIRAILLLEFVSWIAQKEKTK